MNGELKALGLTNHLLTMNDLKPPRHKEQDITEEMLERFFPDIPKSQVDFKHGCVVGKPGCGKTELFKARAKYAFNKYGAENLNLIYTDDLRVGVQMMNNLPVQYLIVDDASKRMSSRAIYEQREVLGVFNRLRHHFTDLGAKTGIVIVEFGWQRWIDLDPGFRDGSSIIFKTNMTTESERNMIRDLIGNTYMNQLDWIWDHMDRGSNKHKGRSIGRIGTKPIDNGGVGFYTHRLVDFPEFPEILLGDEWLDDKGRYIEPRNNIHYMEKLIDRGLTQTEVADKLGISQSAVSKGLQKAREEKEKDGK